MNVVALLLLVVCASAADLPLGIVEKVDKDVVLVRFDAATRIAAGHMIALYGSGTVVKHPLTHKVLTENRKLVAKAQVQGAEGELLRARVLWRDNGAVPEIGWDAVPLPGEAAPNSPPVKTVASIVSVSASAGGTVTIKAPIADPDGESLVYTWELIGGLGRCGRLDARTTVVPEIVWTAPAVAPEGGIAVSVTARDPLGQEVAVSIPLELKGNEDARRVRKPFAGFGGGQEPTWTTLRSCDDGGWVGIDDGGKLFRVAAGWQQAKPMAVADGSLRRPIAAVVRARELYVLDSSKQIVQVFTEAGQTRRVCTGLSTPTDLAVGADGTVFVADNDAGGVLIFEANGKFRARVGRTNADDGFTRLQRICLDNDGNLNCLDGEARKLVRFSRDLRRLDTWTIVGDPKVAVVDLCWHQRGLLVLLADGSLQLLNAKGAVAETWKAASTAGLAEDMGSAMSLTADVAGDTVVLYRGGILARHASTGQVTGVRGPQLRRDLGIWSADGTGRLIGMNTDYGLIHVHDAEGWRTVRVGGRIKNGGPFSEASAMVMTPDGAALAVLDVDKKSVVRFDARDWRKPPLIFGNYGKNNGQFQSPVSIAMDEAGRCYVLDEDAYRVSVFDPQGIFLFGFGEKGTAAHQVYAPKLVAVSPAGDAAYIYDADTYEVKKFNLDQAAKTARHIGNGGGKGYELGQHRTPVVMGVDRFGILHVFDSKRDDWQAIDFRGNGALALVARKSEEVLRSAATMALAPDGQIFIISGTEAVGLR